MTSDDTEWILTVTGTHIASEDWKDELLCPMSWGRVTADTLVYVSAEEGESEEYAVVGATSRPAEALPNTITVRCNDDEIFVCKKRVLQPCIALTRFVAAGFGKYKDASSAEEAFVDVDCCCFDRVLLYLESEMQGERSCARI